MEEQVANAIEIASNPSADPALKTQAFDFVNQLRSDPSGWQVCLSLFTQTPQRSGIVRHVALEVVNSAAQGGLIDLQALAYVKDGLLAYLRQVYGQDAGASDPPNIQNKIAQTITFLFSALYASGWESFFDDLLGLTQKSPSSTTRDNASGIIFYLRVINSIHDEIGDVLVSRSRNEQDKANALKDLIRQRDMQKITSSWQQILSEWRDGNDVIVEMCLKAVGSWVSWIDIGLVVNQTMLDLLFQQLGRAQKEDLRQGEEKVRDAAVDVFTEIIGKKMKPEDKIDMIIFLNLDTIVSQLSNSPPLHGNRFTFKYDTDLAETVAKLVNITVIDIVRALEQEGVSTECKEKANGLLQAFLPHILRYFSDEYDEVCSTVIPCVSDLLTYLRRIAKVNPALASQHSSILLPILKAIIAKMRYDETSSWGEEDEQTDEAEFQELRKRLGILQQMIASINEQLYMEVVSEMVATTFENLRQSGSQMDWRDLDLALHEMFLFGDLAVKAGSLYTKGNPNNQAAETLIEMMLRMVESDIRSFTHPATQLQYTEICVRYSSFFHHHTHLIPGVLENFLQLVHHPIKKVKTRSWYLFQRLVKQLRQYVGNVAQTVVEALGDLLVIRAELPSEVSEGDEMSSEDHELADAIFNSQLYLFEAVGIICSTPTISPDKQVLYLQAVLNPIFLDMEKNLEAAKSQDERAILQIHHDIMALGTLARGFSDWMPGTNTPATLPAPEVSAAFNQVAEATLVALESLKSSFNVRTAARFAFSRLIGVLGSRILPQLPRWIDGLLTQTSSRDEMALFLRLLDQVIFGFKGEIFSILDTLLTPFLQRVFSGIADPTTGTDDEIQLAELKREYLNFLLAVLNNDLGAVIISERNQPIFETVISTIEHFSKDIDDFTTAKMAFSVLSKMSSSWGGPDVIAEASNGTPPSQAPLPGFGQFMITRFSPLCWALPSTPSFNSKDAQAKQVLAEAGGLQRTIYAKTGMEYLTYLRDRELPGMGMGGELIEEFVGALSRLDLKGFRQFFPSFIQRLSA
ncbi:pre-tRNA nuclear export protein [Aspergillus fumigatus]